MKIYWRLMHSDPQTLVDLDNYQHRHYGGHIEVITEEPELAAAVPIQVEDIKEIDKCIAFLSN